MISESKKNNYFYFFFDRWQIAQLPKYTASVVFRSVKNQCQAYQDYASAFESLNVKRLRNEFTKWADAFRKVCFFLIENGYNKFDK